LKLFAVLGVALGLAVAAPVAAPAHAQAPIDAFIQQDEFRGAALSGNGKYIAGIRREAVGDVLVVLEWDTKKSTPVQYARTDQNMEIINVRWKGSDRLIFIVQQEVRVQAGGKSIRRTETIADAFIRVSRIWSSNADGSGLVALYNPSDFMDLPREIDAAIVDMLPGDDDHILLIAPALGGTELRKVNVRTGVSTEEGWKPYLRIHHGSKLDAGP
jgi:hypothetical protein